MPPAIAGALIALAPELGATLFTIGGTAITAASVISYGVVAGISIGGQFALSRLTQKKPSKGDPQIGQLTVRQSLPPRQRLYGRTKLGGALFTETAFPAPGQSLVLGVVHFEDESDGIESWWLNDANAAINPVLHGGNNLAPPWLGNIVLETRLGTDTQPNSVILAAGGWDGPLKGLCYTVMECNQPPRPEKNFQYFYPNGVPSLRVVARGSKVYDPRDATQDWNNKATWKWSRNSALITLDYLTIARVDASGTSIPRGMGLPKSRINLASFIAFANVCDELVPTIYTTDGLGTVVSALGSEPRYSCDGLYSLDEAPTEVLGRILATCDGTLSTLADGTVGIHGGKWAAPTVTIDDSMILSADFSQGNDKFESFNQLKIQITSSNLDYQLVEGSPWDDFTSQSESGVLSQELPLPMVQSYSQARRLAKIAMAKGNPAWRYTSLVCSLAALNALGEQFVHMTHSLPGIDDDFLVVGFKFNTAAMTCELQLASIDATAFDFDPASEDLPPPGTSIFASLAIPSVPTIVLIVSGTAAGGAPSGPVPTAVFLTLADPSSAPVAHYEVDHRIHGSGSWSTVSSAPGASSVEIDGYGTGDVIDLRARAVNAAGSSANTTVVQYTVNPGSGPTFDSTSVRFDQITYTWDMAS